jgi:G protein-coupled receptor 139
MALIFSLDTSLVPGQQQQRSNTGAAVGAAGGSVAEIIFSSPIFPAVNESIDQGQNELHQQHLYGSPSSSLNKEPLSSFSSSSSWFSSPSLSVSSLSSYTDGGSGDSDLSLLTGAYGDEFVSNYSSIDQEDLFSNSFVWLHQNMTSLALTSDASEEEMDSYREFLEGTRFWVQKVLVPILMVIGVIGNSITIMIMTRRRMRSSTNNYLAALAIMDMMYLIFTFILSLSHYSHSRQSDYYAYWHLRPYLLMFTDACSNCSVWLTVTFTIERFIVVSHPIRGKVWCTESRSRKVIITVFLICFAWTLPTPFEYVIKETFDADHNVTLLGLAHSELGSNAMYKSVYYWMTSSLFIFVPLILLAIFNSFLIRSVHISRTQRSGMTQATSHSGSSPNPPKGYANSAKAGKTSSKVRSVMTTSGGVTSKLEPTSTSTPTSTGLSVSPAVTSSSSSSNSQETKITVMLIAVVILFLFCQLPTAIMLIVSSIHEFDEGSRGDYVARGLGNIFNFLVGINSAGNFLLYCFFSQRYRTTFVSLFCPCYKRHMRYFKSGTATTATYSAATTTNNVTHGASTAKPWYRPVNHSLTAASSPCNASPSLQKVHQDNACSKSLDARVDEKEMVDLRFDHRPSQPNQDDEKVNETTPMLSGRRNSLPDEKNEDKETHGKNHVSDSFVVTVDQSS